MNIIKNRSGLLLLIFILIGIYFFVLGDSGIIERKRLLQGIREVRDKISWLKQENYNLQKEYSIVSDNRTNSDFYRKEAERSGYIAEGEKYVYFKSADEDESVKTQVKEKKSKYTVELFHMRILWAVASIMLLLLYFGHKKRQKDKQKGETF